MSVKPAPRVSIGMPVRNGERYIRQAIESILSQSFEDLELIISDNASTDATREICLDYESRDNRVRYVRNARDIGPAENFNRCFRRARGEYFKWQAHDDICAESYLARCVDVLDADSSFVNCHSRTRVIDEAGEVVGDYQFRTGTDAPRAHVRFGRLINVSHRQHVGYEIFGVMRRAVMAGIPEQGAYAHADRVLLVRMSLCGRFWEVDEPLFLARRHASQSMAFHDQRDLRSLLSRYIGAGPLPPPEWWDASMKGRISFPDWNLLRHYWISVSDAPLSGREQALCRLHIGRWVLRFWPKLGRDLIFAGERWLSGMRRGAASPAGSSMIGDERPEEHTEPATVERAG